MLSAKMNSWGGLFRPSRGPDWKQVISCFSHGERGCTVQSFPNSGIWRSGRDPQAWASLLATMGGGWMGALRGYATRVWVQVEGFRGVGRGKINARQFV